MLFNSYEFIFLFLPVVFFGFFVIGRYNSRFAAVWLVVASVFFLWLVEPEICLPASCFNSLQLLGWISYRSCQTYWKIKAHICVFDFSKFASPGILQIH